MEVGGLRQAPAALFPRKTRYPLYRRLGGPQGWSGSENLLPTGIRSPDRPARSESLYRLRSPGPWSGGISPPILHLALFGCGGQRHGPMTFTPQERKPVHIE
jgi:hypothetical protein